MVALVKRFQRAWSAFRAPEQKQFPLPLTWHIVNTGVNWAMIDYEAYAQEGFSQNAVIYSAIKYKMDAIAQAPMRVYTGHPLDPELYENLNHPLAQLSLRPNDYQSQVEFMQYCVMYLNLHGNCFVYITGINDNLPLGMYPLRPDRVRIIPQKKGNQRNGKAVIGYAYYPDGVTNETMVPILPENMMHIKFPNPYDPLEGQGFGLSPLSAGARSADTDNAMTFFLNEYFQNKGIMPGAVITLPYVADSEDIEKLRAQIQDEYGGADNWGKPLVVDGAGDYKHMLPSFSDMALDQIDLRNIRRTTVVFGVPARLIGLDEANSTYNNISEAKDDFWQRTMYSELLLFEEEFRHKLRFEGDEVFIRYDLSHVPGLSDDTASMVQVYTELVSNFVPPNEAKKLAGLKFPDIEGGDIPYMPVGLTPVKDVLNPPQPQLPPGIPNSNPADESPSPDNEGDMDDVDTPAEEAEKGNAPLLQLADGTVVSVPPIDGATYGGIHDGIDDGNDPVHYSQGVILDALRKTINSWDFDTKQVIAKTQDAITEAHEIKWEAGMRKIFKQQQAAVMAIWNREKAKALKDRKSVEINQVELAIQLFLYSQGLTSMVEILVPLVVALIVDLRLDWKNKLGGNIPDFDLLFVTRASIEGEAWFAGYTLKFAKEIQDTTREGIHAVIRDGLAEGYGTDKIGNKLELLFDQYMSGGTSPEDWAFMQERMPPYRTEMIARTETHGAMSNSNHALFKRVGVIKKEWWATRDDRTRDSHLQAWSRYSEGGAIGPIDIDDKFIVGGAEMLHPGDKTAPLREFINCRCVELPVVPED